jgi:hypothetical protein
VAVPYLAALLEQGIRLVEQEDPLRYSTEAARELLLTTPPTEWPSLG